MIRNVRIYTFGCQMNEYDSEVMAGLLAKEGWAIADDEAAADVILLNTCSVRRHAEERVWGKLFELRDRAKAEPGLVIGVCGCMAQGRAGKIARRCPHVRLICGTKAFSRLPALIRQASLTNGMVVDIGMDHPLPSGGLPKLRKKRITAFVPIMRGCENFCAYCVVPYVRGKETSRLPEEILGEIKALAGDGAKEVMLLGQNVNSYKGGMTFAELLHQVSRIDGIERIRFMTSHPKDFPGELIRALAKEPKVCKHLHLPLQSGSDRILQKMNRRYTVAFYRALVDRLREAAPGIALSTDLIVGFPGEDEEDYNQTLRAVEDIRFDGAFMFKYSDREETDAFLMKPKIPEPEIIFRHARLLQVQEKISAEKNRALLGKRVEVLVEGLSPRNGERLFGRTGTNKRVVFPGSDALTGRLVLVTIEQVTSLTLKGTFSAPL